MGGKMGGWMEVKSILRIAYSNQKSIQLNFYVTCLFWYNLKQKAIQNISQTSIINLIVIRQQFGYLKYQYPFVAFDFYAARNILIGEKVEIQLKARHLLHLLKSNKCRCTHSKRNFSKVICFKGSSFQLQTQLNFRVPKHAFSLIRIMQRRSETKSGA